MLEKTVANMPLLINTSKMGCNFFVCALLLAACSSAQPRVEAQLDPNQRHLRSPPRDGLTCTRKGEAIKGKALILSASPCLKGVSF